MFRPRGSTIRLASDRGSPDRLPAPPRGPDPARPCGRTSCAGQGPHRRRATPRRRPRGLSIRTLERRMRAVTRRLGHRPGTRPALARAAAAGDPGTVGSWSGVLAAPVVPIFEALLPSGKILMWDSVGDAPAESYPTTPSRAQRSTTRRPTRPSASTSRATTSSAPASSSSPTATSSSPAATSTARSHGIRQTHVFDWRTETWSRGPDMQDGRWYPSVASMPNDEALIIGGGPTVAEIRTDQRRAAPADRLHDAVEPRVPVRAGGARTAGRCCSGPAAAMSLIDTRRPRARSPPPATATRSTAPTAATRPTTSAASWSRAAAA